MIEFLKSHFYYFCAAVLVILLLIGFMFYLRWKKRRKKQQEITRIQQRDEALNAALRNPHMHDGHSEVSAPPVEIHWDDKVTGKQRSAMQMFELVELSDYSRRKYVFPATHSIQIGSGATNQLVLSKRGVAQTHCEIFLMDSKPCVRSMSSAPAILKRGKATAEISSTGVYLRNRDQIQLGSTELQFRMFRA